VLLQPQAAFIFLLGGIEQESQPGQDYALSNLFQPRYITLEPRKQRDVGCRSPREPPPPPSLDKRSGRSALQLPGGLSWMTECLTSLRWSPKEIDHFGRQLLNCATCPLCSQGFHSPVQLLTAVTSQERPSVTRTQRSVGGEDKTSYL